MNIDVNMDAEEAFQKALLLDDKDDFDGATLFYEIASNQNHAEATFKLARLYDFRGKHLDYDKARILYEKAISLGSVKAINNLGCMYEEGKGVVKDVKRAISLYTEAIDNKDTNAMVNMAFMHEENENFGESRRLYQMAIEHGNIRAVSNLALIYFFGKDGEEDWEKAKETLLYGYQQKDPDSTYLLAFLFYDVFGLEPNAKHAEELYHEAIALGDGSSLYAMGLITRDRHENHMSKQHLERYLKHKDTQKDENLASAYAILAEIYIEEPSKDWKSWKRANEYAQLAIELIEGMPSDEKLVQMRNEAYSKAKKVRDMFNTEKEYQLGAGLFKSELQGDTLFVLQ